MSNRVSLFKSPTATENGPEPVEYVICSSKRTDYHIQVEHSYYRYTVIGDNDIQSSIIVQITNSDRRVDKSQLNMSFDLEKNHYHIQVEHSHYRYPYWRQRYPIEYHCSNHQQRQTFGPIAS